MDGRQTLTGQQFRVNSAGNIDADPKTGKLYLVFSDNRAGRHDVANPVTDVNVYMMTSTDGPTGGARSRCRPPPATSGSPGWT